jgi:hypothetical protein
MSKDFEAAIGISRLWDAREAGREVAHDAIRQLHRPPDFLMVFCTIHYEQHGGMEEFLKGVWDVLPINTPLIGGTVAGFMNNKGVFSRGATALAVADSDMNIAIGYGRNTKRNPKKAVNESLKMIEGKIKRSSCGNKLIFTFVSGTSVMKIPGHGYKKVLDSGMASKFAIPLFGMSQYLFQKGFGREDEIFFETVKKLPDFHVILGASMDDYKGISNYQFFNQKIMTNSVVNLAITTNCPLDVCTTHGMRPSKTKFTISKLSRNKHIIHKINGKPAVPELLRILHWPEGFLDEKTVLRRILYYPISSRSNGKEIPSVMAAIVNKSIISPCILEEGEVNIMTVSGKNLISAMQRNLDHYKEMNPNFGFFSTCITILESLGNKNYMIQDQLAKYFKEKPFLMIFSPGEGTYGPNRELTYANMSFNTVIFGEEDKKRDN